MIYKYRLYCKSVYRIRLGEKVRIYFKVQIKCFCFMVTARKWAGWGGACTLKNVEECDILQKIMTCCGAGMPVGTLPGSDKNLQKQVRKAIK